MSPPRAPHHDTRVDACRVAAPASAQPILAHRRGVVRVAWVVAANRSGTPGTRVATTVAWSAHGETRDWKDRSP